MKKVLILSMTCGEGHNAVASSLKSELEQLGASVQIEQIYGYNPREVEFQNNLFLFASKHFAKPYDIIWNMQRHRNPEKRYTGGIQGSIKKATAYVKEKIDSFQPNSIVCVHFYAGAIVANLKRNNQLAPSIKTYSILTDYCVHPFWETNHLLDYVFVPVDYVKGTLVEKGFSPNQIVCTGFPVHKKFLTAPSKPDARNKLNLHPTVQVGMIVSGGYCLANPLPIVKQLMHQPSLELLVVCGKNEKRLRQMQALIQKHNLTNVKAFGFVSNVHEMMAASDFVISRGGANFITEAIQMELPIVFREKTIINEKLNAQLLTQHGCSLMLDHPSEISKCIQLLSSPSDYAKMVNQIKSLKKPNALHDICTFVFKKGETQ